MRRYITYPWAILWGVYYYVLFQLVYLARFGSLNMSFNVLDISLFANGILSVVVLVFFWHKLERKQSLLLIPFSLALPFSIVGGLSGGLLGPIGVVVFGLVPFALLLPLGYWFIKRSSSGASTPQPPMSSAM